MPEDRGDLVDTTYAGSDDPSGKYEGILKAVEETGLCPFCSPGLQENNEVLQTLEGWQIIADLWPYEHAVGHYLILPVEHLTDRRQIRGKDWIVIQRLIDHAESLCETLKIGGGLALRFGTNSGMTVRHLHVHLIIPETDPETGKVRPGKHVNFRFG